MSNELVHIILRSFCIVKEKSREIRNNFEKKVSDQIYFAFNTAKIHIPKIDMVINLDIQKIILYK